MQKKDILFFILATILFIICCFISINSYATTINRVVDGDTFVINKPKPPLELMQTRHRIAGIDAPESFKQAAKCKKEIELGLKAKAFVSNFVKGGVEIVYLELDKYGRYLVNVDKNGLNLADELVRNGLAVYYDGGTKEKDWCK
jgi:endonuclease YncB( thermonuclease family)